MAEKVLLKFQSIVIKFMLNCRAKTRKCVKIGGKSKVTTHTRTGKEKQRKRVKDNLVKIIEKHWKIATKFNKNEEN